MGSESKIIRDEKFLEDIINSIDEKIQKCFKSLNQGQKEGIKYYASNDNFHKESNFKTAYVTDCEILDSVYKLEILRHKYYNELQNLIQKNK
jgi:hypothetical protein